MEPTFINYQLVEETDIDKFQEFVNQSLDAGFKLHGPTTVIYDDELSTVHFFQAMIREEKPA